LAQQIDDEVVKFTSPLALKSICIVGGAAMEQQTLAIRIGAEIIIATPVCCIIASRFSASEPPLGSIERLFA
jgi:superfamily II DNA/RNA helicase